MKTKIKKKKLKGVRNPMIKGINRQVVEVKDTGNDCFEKILFNGDGEFSLCDSISNWHFCLTNLYALFPLCFPFYTFQP